MRHVTAGSLLCTMASVARQRRRLGRWRDSAGERI